MRFMSAENLPGQEILGSQASGIELSSSEEGRKEGRLGSASFEQSG